MLCPFDSVHLTSFLIPSFHWSLFLFLFSSFPPWPSKKFSLRITRQWFKMRCSHIDLVLYLLKLIQDCLNTSQVWTDEGNVFSLSSIVVTCSLSFFYWDMRQVFWCLSCTSPENDEPNEKNTIVFGLHVSCEKGSSRIQGTLGNTIVILYIWFLISLISHEFPVLYSCIMQWHQKISYGGPMAVSSCYPGKIKKFCLWNQLQSPEPILHSTVAKSLCLNFRTNLLNPSTMIYLYLNLDLDRYVFWCWIHNLARWLCSSMLCHL